MHDPHEREYAAAVSGMQDTYGWHDSSNTPHTFAVGDYVSGITCGKRWSGRIWNVEGDRLSVEIHGGWLAVSARDVTH